MKYPTLAEILKPCMSHNWAIGIFDSAIGSERSHLQKM
jgi:hypothetical protein